MIDRKKIMDILDNCKKVIEARKGHGDDTFKDMALLASTYLGIEVTERDVAVLMTLFKIARMRSGNKDEPDHYVDAANYLIIAASMIDNKPEKYNPAMPLPFTPGPADVQPVSERAKTIPTPEILY